MSIQRRKGRVIEEWRDIVEGGDYQHTRNVIARPVPLMSSTRIIGILLLGIGGLIFFTGCTMTGYFVVLFDTTVSLDPDMDRHGFGHLSRRVNNLGLMHQQSVWTIVGIAVMFIGLAIAIVGLVLCVIRRNATKN